MNDATTAILEWHQKEITGTQLMRRLVSYEKWNLPMSEAGVAESLATNMLTRFQFNEAEDGKKRMLLYTDFDSYKEGMANSGEPLKEQHFLTTTGTCVFRIQLEGFASILINPETPSFIYYEAHQFDALRKLAAAIEIEDLIAKMRRGEGPDGTVRRVGQYADFSIAMQEADGQSTICLAPDTKNRNLIAVFTADDAYDAFAAELPPEEVDITKQLPLPGDKLFGFLQKQQIDGIVFNCCGPVKPVAFQPAISTVILDELNAAK